LQPQPAFLELGGFHAFDSEHDGFGGPVIGVNWQGDLGTTVHPYIGANFGGVLGKGVQDGLVASPEAGLKFDLSEKWLLYAKGATTISFATIRTRGSSTADSASAGATEIKRS
jgi:hypothetical protein